MARPWLACGQVGKAAADLQEAEAGAEAKAVSVVATLCVQLQVGIGGVGHDQRIKIPDSLARLIAKFLEDGAVKVKIDKCV